MIPIQRPGQEPLEIDFILIGFEGTLAPDRRVHPKAKDKINLLSKRSKIYILTKEEKQRIEDVLRKVKAEVVYLTEEKSSEKKSDLVTRLGATRTVSVGNGTDDASMMKAAAFALCVIGKGGASVETVKNADVVFTDVLDALDFLLKPLRQKAILSL